MSIALKGNMERRDFLKLVPGVLLWSACESNQVGNPEPWDPVDAALCPRAHRAG